MTTDSSDFDSSDIREMRQQGDLRSFLRSQMKRPDGAQGGEIPDAAPPKSRPDGLPVGMWPAHLHHFGCPVFSDDARGCACHDR